MSEMIKLSSLKVEEQQSFVRSGNDSRYILAKKLKDRPWDTGSVWTLVNHDGQLAIARVIDDLPNKQTQASGLDAGPNHAVQAMMKTASQMTSHPCLEKSSGNEDRDWMNQLLELAPPGWNTKNRRESEQAFQVDVSGDTGHYRVQYSRKAERTNVTLLKEDGKTKGIKTFPGLPTPAEVWAAVIPPPKAAETPKVVGQTVPDDASETIGTGLPEGMATTADYFWGSVLPTINKWCGNGLVDLTTEGICTHAQMQLKLGKITKLDHDLICIEADRAVAYAQQFVAAESQTDLFDGGSPPPTLPRVGNAHSDRVFASLATLKPQGMKWEAFLKAYRGLGDGKS